MNKTCALAIVWCFLSAISQGACWPYDFGSGADEVYDLTNSASTTFLPQPSADGGTARVRMGTGFGEFRLQPTTIGEGGRELQIKASANSAVHKFAIYDWSPGANVFSMRYRMLLTGGRVGTSVPRWQFYLGNGAAYTNNDQALAASVTFVGLEFVFGTNGVITSGYRMFNGGGYGFAPLPGNPITQDVAYTIEIFGNNSMSQEYYTYNGPQSVATNAWDLWLNGTLLCDDFAKAAMPDNQMIDSFVFIGWNSVSNVSTIKLDDIVYANELIPEPAALGLCTLCVLGCVWRGLRHEQCRMHKTLMRRER